jgi:hypothetical protein
VPLLRRIPCDNGPPNNLAFSFVSVDDGLLRGLLLDDATTAVDAPGGPLYSPQYKSR